jgi:hypothetical protein
VRKADNLTAICEPNCLEKMWEPRRLTIVWAFAACYRDSYIFTYVCLSRVMCLLDSHLHTRTDGCVDMTLTDIYFTGQNNGSSLTRKEKPSTARLLTYGRHDDCGRIAPRMSLQHELK